MVSYLLSLRRVLLPGDPLSGRGRIPVGATDGPGAVAGPVVKVRHDGRGRVRMRRHVVGRTTLLSPPFDVYSSTMQSLLLFIPSHGPLLLFPSYLDLRNPPSPLRSLDIFVVLTFIEQRVICDTPVANGSDHRPTVA